MIEGEEVSVGTISWGEESSLTMDEILPGDKPTKTPLDSQCLTWMSTALKDAPQPAEFMEAEAHKRNFSDYLVKKVKKQTKIESHSVGFTDKKWYWFTPEQWASAKAKGEQV